ncbi:MAG: hypothetical protein A2V67_13465 [Deltaproteobacteria bacterium RBG_13_61_14]|nr:MAG: hypothetical protein A2V67_13465 [Deltaproteobacteria bacterium RBG_13_61_14]
MRARNLKVIFSLAFLLPATLYAEEWSAPQYITELNSAKRDVTPWISADGKTVYIASDRIPGGTCSRCGMEIFVSHLVDGLWTAPERLPEPLNDPLSWDGHPSLTLDGRYMYFHSNRPSPFNPGTRQADDTDIWVSENINGVWQQPVVLGANINTTYWDYAPQISVDGQTLIYTSNRPGGYGNFDLYISHKVDGVWQKSENMGPVINNSIAQVAPNVSYTGKYMFLSDLSNVYRSIKVDGVWQTPIKLPPPVNQCWSGTESSIFNDCTQTLYFYNMCSPLGSWDIATTQWLDFPDPNPCDNFIIPEGQWRVRVTLLEASADLSNDIYLDQPISQLLIKHSLKNVGKVVSTPFLSAEELIFHIHVDANNWGLGEYDHYSNSEFARVQRTDPLRYLVGFEDLPADLADWDYNDTVLLVELVGVEVNIWESQNYLGENQVVQSTPADQDTALVLLLTSSAGVEATAVIPGAGLSESTYGVLTEGDPALYTDLIQPEAPLAPTGVFLKLELENGQTQLLDGQAGIIKIAYADEDDDGIVDGTSVAETGLVLARYDEESGAWMALPSEVDPVADNVTCAMNQFFPIFALGTWTTPDEEPPPVEPPVEPPANPPPADASGPKLHSTDSGSGPGCLSVAAASDPAGWAAVVGLLGLLGSGRLIKRRPR